MAALVVPRPAHATRAGYVRDVLSEAQRFSQHRAGESGEPALSKEDIALAVQTRLDFSCAGPPPREVFTAAKRMGGWTGGLSHARTARAQFLMELANKKNEVPLPMVPDDQVGRVVHGHTPLPW